MHLLKNKIFQKKTNKPEVKKHILAGNQERNKNTKRYLWQSALKVNNHGQEHEVMLEIRKHYGSAPCRFDPKTISDDVKM